MSTLANSDLQKFGLSTLHEVPLPEAREKYLSDVCEPSQGSPTWRARKRAEVRDLLALETIADRLTVIAIESSTELLAIVRMKVTVPCMTSSGELVVVGQVDLALRYPEKILHAPLPGYALVQIPMPRRVWHPNISSDSAQALCLGANVPQGFPLREALLGSYAALTLQALSLNREDSAGVMNQAALAYWCDHTNRIPLSTAAFLEDSPSNEIQSSKEKS
jgi:hypothetical protein